jgi:sulfate-transporting ATPase
MAGEYIFTMRDLRKVVPPSREILKGIHLAFFPGAKIGVLGANGAGKSSLLRIMAGVDKDFLGDARPLPGTKIGYLPQEPQLDPAKDVRGNVEEAVAEQRGMLRQFEEISARFAEPMDDDEMTRLLEKQGNLQERIDALGLWELDHKVDIAMDALRLPPGDADVARLSGGERRRVALCRVLLEQPDMLLLDEPTNHLDAESVWWLERFLAQFPGTVVAVTHDRYFLDNVAGWILELYLGRGDPLGGELLLLAGAEGASAGAGREAGLRPAEDAAARARMGADGPPGAAGQEQGAHRPVRGASGRGRPADRGLRGNPDPRA